MQDALSPWPNVAAARSFLRFLVGLEEAAVWPLSTQQLANWLILHGLGPFAYRQCQQGHPQLAQLLQDDLFSAAAENSLHFTNLAAVIEQFRGKIPVVLLKGVALAEQAYGGQMYRTMSDVDIWVPPVYISEAVTLMQAAGFCIDTKTERPQELQTLAHGELRFYRPEWSHNLVELHLSPFAGWWLMRTAAIDNNALWAHIEPIDETAPVYQMQAEDAVIHIAVHTAVNHQFGLAGIRSLVDLALTAQHRRIDWQLVVTRAKAWRVGTAVWLVLLKLEQLIGLPGVPDAIDKLQPPQLRRRQLDKWISPESILAGNDLRTGWLRYLFLLGLIDRKRDMVKLIWRTLWPESTWLAARYGRPVNQFYHLAHVLRHKKV